MCQTKKSKTLTHVYQRGKDFFEDENCTIPLRLDDMTAEQWANMMFECSLCEDCMLDQDEHDIIPFNGHWFARCKHEFPTLEEIGAK
jgi:hypothetical protein